MKLKDEEEQTLTNDNNQLSFSLNEQKTDRNYLLILVLLILFILTSMMNPEISSIVFQKKGRKNEKETIVPDEK